jgi:hypothetical protein
MHILDWKIKFARNNYQAGNYKSWDGNKKITSGWFTSGEILKTLL